MVHDPRLSISILAGIHGKFTYIPTSEGDDAFDQTNLSYNLPHFVIPRIIGETSPIPRPHTTLSHDNDESVAS